MAGLLRGDLPRGRLQAQRGETVGDRVQANVSMPISVDVNGPNSAVRRRVRMPKFARASANRSVMPLAKSSSVPSVAAIRGPVEAFVRWRLNSSASPASPFPFACEPKSRRDRRCGSTRPKVQREAGTTSRIPEMIGYADLDSGIASCSDSVRSASFPAWVGLTWGGRRASPAFPDRPFSRCLCLDQDARVVLVSTRRDGITAPP